MLTRRVLGMGDAHHGGRATAGGEVPWWLWVLLVWGALAVVVGILIGLAIRTAERREFGEGRTDERVDDEEPDGRRRRPEAS